ncbi:MAG TPA: cyclodeaminase/cyclohydrolase family protein [Tepidisphaeraceae bacterium]|jgi:formiminotetrahydrofolate cyclodeaminase|nr:cyclodeaminase/cyclohydrolase family protein [Tepidisphaeraceae bacterium]
MYDSKTPLDQFLAAAAARQPTPGGGSATAVVGALAAAMGEMVLQYSIGKKNQQAIDQELIPVLAEMTRARQMLLQLMVEDQIAYEALTRLKKLPADSQERKEEYAPALIACIRVPEAMAVTGIVILELCDRVVNFANYYLLSDLAVCADLAMTTTRCGIYNVRVNLKDLPDEADRRKFEANIGQMLHRAAELIQRVSPRVWARDSQGI